jgi:hypothetical protein
MNHRDLNLEDREHRLRAAIESLKHRIPKCEKPSDAVVPAWDGRGGLVCPKCGGTCFAPTAPNPYRCFKEEKMVLVPGKINECPHRGCGAAHFVTEELARLHNSFYYPEDYRESREKKDG